MGIHRSRRIPVRTARPDARGVRAVGRILAGTFSVLVLTGSVTAGEDSIEERLATASPANGESLFRACGACHTITKGTAHTIGPNLWDVIGRPVASAEGYDRYTPAMSSFGGIWSPERLDRYLRQPMVEVEGTGMVFPGMPDAGDRADVIAWLNRHSPAPADFGSGRAASGDAAAPAPRRSGPPDLGVFVAGEGAEATHAYCTACHSERIVAQQGLTREGWEEVLEYMVEEQGMTSIEEPDRDRVLGYLSTHYGPDRPNFPLR